MLLLQTSRLITLKPWLAFFIPYALSKLTLLSLRSAAELILAPPSFRKLWPPGISRPPQYRLQTSELSWITPWICNIDIAGKSNSRYGLREFSDAVRLAYAKFRRHVDSCLGRACFFGCKWYAPLSRSKYQVLWLRQDRLTCADADLYFATSSSISLQESITLFFKELIFILEKPLKFEVMQRFKSESCLETD